MLIPDRTPALADSKMVHRTFASIVILAKPVDRLVYNFRFYSETNIEKQVLLREWQGNHNHIKSSRLEKYPE